MQFWYLVQLKRMYNWISSAVIWDIFKSAQSVLKNRNNKGPKTEPWGTPKWRWLKEDLSFEVATQKEWSERYEVNHCKADPIILAQYLNLSSKTWGSTVSKTEVRSNIRRTGQFPVSLCTKTPLKIREELSLLMFFKTAVSCLATFFSIIIGL